MLRGLILALTAALVFISTAQAQTSDFTSHYYYDLAGHVTGTVASDPDGAGTLEHPAVRNTYDSGGRLVLVETGEIATVPTGDPSAWSGFTVFDTEAISYDGFDKKIKATLSSGGTAYQVTQYSYDAYHRPICTALRMNPAKFASEPTNACSLGTTGSYGQDRIAKNVYDAAGQLLQVIKALGTTAQATDVTYSYSANGRPLTVTDANGNEASYTYDGFDRLAQWNFPDKVTTGAVSATDYEAYAYDANGNRTGLRKRDGQVICAQVDALNRVKTKFFPGSGTAIATCATAAVSGTQPVYYGYDLQGHQLYARFGSASGVGITNLYDGFGEPTSASSNMDGTARALTYQYDADGNRTRVTHPDGTYFSYIYDGLDRPTAILQQGATQVAAFAYDAAGRRASDARGSVTQAYGYDGVSRLTSLAHDLAGTTDDVNWTLSYNPADQIISSARTNDLYATTLAATDKSYTVNGLNQYTDAGGAALAYDANGNLSSDGTISYGYDTENRLVSASSGVTLDYDPLGRLWRVTGPSTLTEFYFDGNALVEERDASGNLLRRYVHGTQEDDPLLWYEGAGLTDRRGLTTNHQGSVVGITDATGAALAIDSYDEYGVPGASNMGRFQYTGQAWIPELGVYYYKARMYSSRLGRFLQTDPIGYGGQFNMYAYVGNDPLDGTDPFGLNKHCTGDTNAPDGTAKGQCQDDGQKPDAEDEVVVIAKRQHKIRLTGPEQFFSVSVDGLRTFNADKAEDCGGFVAYHTDVANFGAGDPGHSHPNGSSDDRENTAPSLGPDDGVAANRTGRAYMVSPVGITRIQRLANGTYSATLVQGQFGESDRTVIARLSQFNRNAGSQVHGGATKAAEGMKKCTVMRTQ